MVDSSTSDIQEILARARVVGLIGASLNPARPSRQVGEFLAAQGLRVIGVNPGTAGQSLFGETIVPRIADLPAEVDFLDVFRRSEAVPAVIDEAIEYLPNLRTVWLQLGIRSEAATRAARAHGVSVVQDRCAKIEILRHFPAGLPVGRIRRSAS